MVAIKNMKMPSCCNECPMYQSEDSDYCDITGEWITGEEMERHSNCPLTEVVTCKDCDHCRFELVEGMPYYWCDKDDCVTSEDFYCANGVRRK